MKRRLFIGGVAAAGAVLAAGLYRFTDLFVKHYPPTQYDDLLGQLTDREQAGKLGKAALQHSHADIVSNDIYARGARKRLAGRDLRSVAAEEIAHSEIVEIDGWVVPTVIALLSILAANV